MRRQRKKRSYSSHFHNYARLSESVHASVNQRSSQENLVLKLPFNFKCHTPASAGGSTVASCMLNQYMSAFPYLKIESILGVKMDRIAVWGPDPRAEASRADVPIYLSVGDSFSMSSVGSATERATIGCVPKLQDGQSDESTIVAFKNCVQIQVTGTVSVRRSAFPAITRTASLGDPSTYSSTGSRNDGPAKEVPLLF